MLCLVPTISGRVIFVRRSALWAFTLIELMVVIAIMVIILAVSIPGLKAITKGNDTVQATNMISSLIANARSLAISQGRVAGVAFYEQNTAKAGQTSAVYLIEDRSLTTATTLVLIPAPNSTAQQLPTGAFVAGIDANLGTLTPASGATRARAVLFDEAGQMVVRGGLTLGASSNASYDAAMQSTLAAWGSDFLWIGGPATSSPGLVVYSQAELSAEAPSNVNQWLLQHSKVLVVNAYTGTVIR